ncbi:MAG: 1,4-dihydroxy-2-naphthoate octaprenyltransferase [Bdellovibrionales bacterium GWA2_49_15]|nr:MAG: 1,4-dihydroxy-2-naphthoate octaprenyltransferase [Bdellovibrionales bacterium GWA2_49_15]HAZ13557.1 1,4-dihydroxy-2-naphthoate octaprenyltransferase [Bdellovibrionales bacterium]
MIKHLLMAIRPKTLFAGIGPVILGLALAHHTLGPQFNYFVAPWPFLVALLLQAASNLINDYYDGKSGVDQHRKFGPARVVAQGLLTAKQVKMAFLTCLALAFSIGVGLSLVRAGWPLFILGMISILFAYLYTGGPFPLSHYAMGEVLALIFFGPVALCGTMYLETLSWQQSLNFYVIANAISCGSLASAIMAINNLRDRESDLRAGKLTLATLLTEQQARLLPPCFIIITFWLPLILFFQTIWSNTWGLKSIVLILTLSLPFTFYKIFRICLATPSGPQHNQALALTGKLLFLYNLAMAFYNLL